MKKSAVALVLAALLVATTNPALAGCGGSHGKAYRAAQGAKKPTVAKGTEQKPSAPVTGTSAPDQTTVAIDTSVGPYSIEL